METKTPVIPYSNGDLRKNNNGNHSLRAFHTLGSLYAKDLPNGFLLPESPSSFNSKAKFFNDERYIRHDFPAYSAITLEYLQPTRLYLAAGNELPLLIRYEPGDHLKQHWKKWLPFLPEPDTRDLTALLEDPGDKICILRYPLQCMPKENHAFDPDVHHKLLSKSAIPEMGARCPHHMSLRDYTVPCMIKASHGAGGKGTYLAKTRKEAEKFISIIQNEMRCPEPSITEVIEGITGNYCLQFYLYKTGDIEWLGCTNQVIGEGFDWLGGRLDWNEQDSLKEKLYDTVMPVKEYLHKKGYFGVVGIDILSNKDENFVVDVNARINGSTPLLLVAPYMAELGYPTSAMLIITDVKGNETEMMEMFDQINNLGKGLVINIASEESPDGKSCKGYLYLFAKTDEGIKSLQDLITVL